MTLQSIWYKPSHHLKSNSRTYLPKHAMPPNDAKRGTPMRRSSVYPIEDKPYEARSFRGQNHPRIECLFPRRYIRIADFD